MKFRTNDNGNLEVIFTSHLGLETSTTNTSLGEQESEMELFINEDDGDTAMIEWVCYAEDIVEHIGLSFENKTLQDYDGVFELPIQAIKLIRKAGYRVPRDFEPSN